MLLLILVLKSLTELSLLFIGGRSSLGWLAGAKRQSNIFWQLLDIASKPALWLTRRISPKRILDRHVPLAAASWLLTVWALLVLVKIDFCLQIGIQFCQ